MSSGTSADYEPFLRRVFRFSLKSASFPWPSAFAFGSLDQYDVARIHSAVRVRSFSIIFGLTVMAVCARGGQTPSEGQSGIEGVITISPANPGPTRADAPASVPLANATFVVENNGGEVT